MPVFSLRNGEALRAPALDSAHDHAEVSRPIGRPIYDWQKVQARLSALPQFVITIDGLEIHFIHVCSKNANALPVIVTHGWPGSIIEQLKIIGSLTDPTAYGWKGGRRF